MLIAEEVDSKSTLSFLMCKAIDVPIYEPGFFFHWVENFPLFSRNEHGESAKCGFIFDVFP